MAVHAERSEMERQINAWFPAAGDTDCARLVNEMIRLARISESTMNDEAEQVLTRTEIIHQLEIIVGIQSPHTVLPWRLEVASSSANDSGDGVMLRGSCEASSVLAVYPGVSYTAADLPLMAKQVIEGNHYMLFLRNGVIIDGRPDGYSRKVFEMAAQRDDDERDVPARDSAPVAGERRARLGVGHLVNHPPRGAQPNVHVVPLDLGRDEHVELHQHLPVVQPPPPWKRRAAGEPWKRTAVLVASRALRDEELWLDYKLRQDAHRLPTWYAPCVPPQAVASDAVIGGAGGPPRRAGGRRVGHGAGAAKCVQLAVRYDY